MHSFDNGIDMGEGEDVFDYNGIDLLVVKYWPKAAVLLFDIEDRCGIWGFQFSD